MNKHIYLIVILACILISSDLTYAEEAYITINFGNETGQVNRKVLGNNFLGYDPATYEDWTRAFYGYSDYGAGIWDPEKNTPVKEAIDLARTAGIKSARFPGGCGAHRYDWKKAIGEKRTHFLFGIDEFMKVCEEINADPVFTISYFAGNEQDAADLIEYLNAAADGSNPNGSVDWAQERAKNGHPEAYGVRYFEFGNEEWHGDHKSIGKTSPEEYSKKYLKYFQKIKEVDPSVKIGVILNEDSWNRKVLEILGDKIDFGILHIYPALRLPDDKLKKMDPNEVLRMTLGVTEVEFEKAVRDTNRLMKQITGKPIPLAITEYNIGYSGNDPLPYRHSLGSALVNGELIRILMKPENNIAIANFWNFVNECWGMINNGFQDKYETLYEKFYKQPSFYVFELYNKHFGDILVENHIFCDTYSLGNSRIPYLSVNTSKNKEGTKLFVIVINRNMYKSMEARINLKGLAPSVYSRALVLNGPSIDATNLAKFYNVSISEKKFNIENATFAYSFEPHSVTALEIERMP